MKPQVSALYNRRRILFLLGGGIGLCVTNSIGQVGYAQPANNSPKLKTSIDPIKSLSDELTSFDENIKQVKQKSGNISSTDKVIIQKQSKSILGNAKNAQSTASQLVNELKSITKWDKNFDAFIESGFRKNGADSRFIAYIAEQGGARAVMEKAASNNFVSELNERVEFQLKSVNITQASLMDILIPPASARCIRCGCIVGVVAAIYYLWKGETVNAAKSAASAAVCVATT
jgi:hypothetical protein